MMMKVNNVKKEMAEAKNLPFITKSIENSNLDDFMKKATLYIVFTLYKLKQ
jgi:hypothetical protein